MMAKTLILMQGIPGSGKSTVARALYEGNPANTIILSTDAFWGEDYNFKPELLGRAHLWNEDRAAAAFRNGTDVIIIDNTNIRRKAVKYYMSLAADYGYNVQVVRVTCDIDLAIARGTHNVPEDVVRRMYSEMEELL